MAERQFPEPGEIFELMRLPGPLTLHTSTMTTQGQTTRTSAARAARTAALGSPAQSCRSDPVTLASMIATASATRTAGDPMPVPATLIDPSSEPPRPARAGRAGGPVARRRPVLGLPAYG